jgi:diguanylate cyclase (GGDEF)-like protein/hemerythrin-like metal-binding protein
MPLHSPTAIMQLFVLVTTLCLAMGWVALADGKDGMRFLACAFALEALSYFIAIFQVDLPSALASLLMFGTVALAYSLMIRALAEFQGAPPPRVWLWWPTLLAACVALGLHDAALSREIAFSFLFLVLDAKALEILFSGERGKTGRGRQLLSAGIGLNAAALFARITYSLGYCETWPEGVQLMQGLYSLSAVASMVLIAIGFGLMAKEAAEEQIRVLAMRDSLTGCWNRVWIGKRARQEMLRLRRYGTPLSMLIIDIDHFKKINDTYGHLAGDAVLQGFAKRVTGCLRETDVFGRWGGEEFILLLPFTGFPAALQVAERVRAALAAAPIAQNVRISASFGVSSCLSTDGWEDWLSRADLALYRAKAGGRDCVEPEFPLQSAGVAAGRESVARLVWHDDALCGEAQIDAQHRALFINANRLLDLHAYPLPGIDLLQEMRNFLIGVDHHFQTEEAVLAAITSTELEPHIGQHQQLMERAHDLLDQHVAGKLAFADLLHFVVYELTAQHLLRDDIKLHASLRVKESAPP